MPSKMDKLLAYMQYRAQIEQVECTLAVTFLQNHFDNGVRKFFGVTVDEDGNILSDEENPKVLAGYQGKN